MQANGLNGVIVFLISSALCWLGVWLFYKKLSSFTGKKGSIHCNQGTDMTPSGDVYNNMYVHAYAYSHGVCD